MDGFAWTFAQKQYQSATVCYFWNTSN